MSLPKPYYQDDAVTIYHADCRDILPDLSDKYVVSLVLTDPPYGIGFKYFNRRQRGHIENYDSIVGDEITFNPEFLLDYPNHPKVIVWGANRFSDQLPVGQWLIWNKRDARQCSNISFADCEMAWHNCGGSAVQVFNWFWVGYFRKGEMKTDYHPAQKPVELMSWCIQVSKIVENAGLVVDPFMGAGSALLAAKKLGCPAIGIEIEEKYCEIAAKRCSQMVMDLNT